MIILLTVSDTYAGLFATTGQIDTDVFDLESTKRDLEESENVMVEDEMSMSADESVIETADDAAAIAFVLDAQDGTTKRFVGVFLQPLDVDAPAVTELDYSGFVRSDMSAEDLSWSGPKWSSDPAPLRRWKITVKNFFEGVIDQVSIHDLVYGNPALSIIGINTLTWYATKVKHAEVAYAPGPYQVRWHQLVSLNEVMRGFADVLADALSTGGFGTFTIDLEESPIGLKMAPAFFHDSGTSSRFRDETEPYKIDWTKEVEPRLGDTTKEYELIIAWADVEPLSVESMPGVEGGAEKEHSVLSCETFVDFVYRLALALGLYVRFEYVTATELKISFASRAGTTKHEVWVPDATKAGLEVGPAESKDKRIFRGFAFTMAAEGTEGGKGSTWYHFDTVRRLYFESEATKQAKKTEGDDLLFSIAPVMRRYGRVHDMPPSFAAACMPHNTQTFVTSTSLPAGNDETFDTKGITNALMINAGTAVTPHYLPVAALRVKINGEEQVFYSLHEFVNALSGRDAAFFKAEYELSIPYICSFRKSSDGSHADDDGGRGRWKNLELGCELTFDGIEYVIVGYERKYRTLETTLRLHRLSRFAFAQATSSLLAEFPAPGAGAYAAAETSEVGFESGEDIKAGDAIAVRSSGKAFRAVALNSDFGRVIGVARADASAGETVRIQMTGIASHGAYSFTPGERVYLRTVAYGSPNLGTRLTGMTATEDLFLELGTAMTASAFRIDFGQQFVFAPGIPV